MLSPKDATIRLTEADRLRLQWFQERRAIDFRLSQDELPQGVDGLPTNQVHIVTIDSRCFEVTVPKAQLFGRLDGTIKLEADGQTFEKPLTDGFDDGQGIYSYRFYGLPWGAKAKVTLILAATIDADQFLKILLDDIPLGGPSDQPGGGVAKAPGTQAPVATAGQATEPDEPKETGIALVRGDGAIEELDA